MGRSDMEEDDFFSPEGANNTFYVHKEIIARIKHAKKSLKIAVIWLTNQEIFDSILEKLETPDFSVDLIVLNDGINNKVEGCDFQKFIDLGGNFYYSDIANMTQYKFCIYDEKSVYVTGFYNWTYHSDNKINWESIVEFDEVVKVDEFIKIFENLKQKLDKIENAASANKFEIEITRHAYLLDDYGIQVRLRRYYENGDEITENKVVNILKKLEREGEALQKLKIMPFEIGILLPNGEYVMIVPALTILPIKIEKTITTVNYIYSNFYQVIKKIITPDKTILQIIFGEREFTTLPFQNNYECKINMEENGDFDILLFNPKTNKEIKQKYEVGHWIMT